jgi:hypothetical protein
MVGSSGGSIEYTITLGNLLTVASFLVFVTVYIVNSRGAAKILATRLATVDDTLVDFKQEMKKLTDVVVSQARMDGRIDLIEQRILQEGRRVDDIAANLGEFKNSMIRDAVAARRSSN